MQTLTYLYYSKSSIFIGICTPIAFKATSVHVYHRSFLSVHPLLARCNSSSRLSCQTYFTISPRPGNALVYIVVRFRADRSIACTVKRGALDNVVHVSNESYTQRTVMNNWFGRSLFTILAIVYNSHHCRFANQCYEK